MLGTVCALMIPSRARLLVHWHSDVLNKGFLAKILRPLEYALLSRASIIVATSKVYADASRTLAPFRNKVTAVPIGVPDTNNKVEESQFPRDLELQIACRKIILAVGRLVPYKGFNVLIQAAQELIKNSVVVIVGDGPLKQELHKAILKARVEDRVLLAGRLSDAALHELFERATLYCLPSTYRAEAFGVVLIEAMTYGLPIVASNISGSGVPWVNQHGVSGLNVPINDAKSLANTCNQILISEELRTKLSNGARQRFLAEFTEEVSVKRILAIYERLFDTCR